MTDEEPRRLTASERAHEITLALLAPKPVAPEYDAELTLNAKGDVQIRVAAKGPDRHAVEEHVREMFEAFVHAYPRVGAALPKPEKGA